MTITEPSAISSIISSNNVTGCTGSANGDATITVSGGTSPYTFLWSDGQTGSSATNLAAGSYSCQITDINGCVSTNNVTISQPVVISSIITSTDVLCYGDATGSATVTVSGGVSPYNYLWSNGQTGVSATNLLAGTYTCDITDVNGCVFTDNVTITEPSSALSSNISPINVLCYGDASGSATVSAGGGTSPYTYFWSNGQIGVIATNLLAGTYTYDITDVNGCVFTDNVTITEPSSALSSSVSPVNVQCYGDASGSASLIATGGTSPYTYLWSNGQTGASATNLLAGIYTYQIADFNGCTFTNNITITEPSSALSSSVSPVNVQCYGDASGSASLIATGGTSPYTYLWDDPLAQTTATATALSAGSYICQITDFNGCTFTNNITITEPSSALSSSITSTDVLCNGYSDGTATVTAAGGTSPYSYSWSNGQTGAIASVLSAGLYTCNVTDFNSCLYIIDITIAEPSVINVLETIMMLVVLVVVMVLL